MDWDEKVGLAVMILLALSIPVAIVAPIVHTSRAEARFEREHPPAFRLGEVVRMRVDGARAVVIGRRVHDTPEYRYIWEVRVGAPGQQRRDGLVSADTAVVAYQKVWVEEFELARDEP